MSQYTKHEALVCEIMLWLQRRYGDRVMVWRNLNGTFRLLRSEDKVTSGDKGRPDIGGVLSTWGGDDHPEHYAQAFAIEVKTAGGKLRADQKRWRGRFVNLGGTYVEARSLEDVEAAFG